jgi:hypothetical protein
MYYGNDIQLCKVKKYSPRFWFHKGQGKIVPAYAMKAYRGSRGSAPLILNLGTGWR